VAASVYARLRPARETIRRVVLLGPAHRMAFRGIAASGVQAFATPLGHIPVESRILDTLPASVGLVLNAAAHEEEHSLEVHLPFLQVLLKEFSLVPLVIGDAREEQVAALLDALWGGPETLIVVSSDLSHYLAYEQARKIDARTRDAIEQFDSDLIDWEQACGRLPLAGLLIVAKRLGLSVETVAMKNSGDTVGPRDRVVGYGAWAFVAPAVSGTAAVAAPSEPASPDQSLQDQAPLLVSLARSAIESWVRAHRRASLPESLPARLRAPGASFVTLWQNGDLRGCIGSPQAWRGLADDVLDNAVKAAVEDPRFPPVRIEELAGLDISVSVLTPPRPMQFSSEENLLTQLRPGIDGLIIEDGHHRALFLPAVWEVLPEPREFLARLKQKAGLPPNHWSASLRAQRFTAVELK